ncbi:MAG: hypothetical protein IOD12_18010 [Silvanigrellales bacterium]|jgi:hypothetical protein|nr:hypothetical protein [Silvanigrellales bacterium]
MIRLHLIRYPRAAVSYANGFSSDFQSLVDGAQGQLLVFGAPSHERAQEFLHRVDWKKGVALSFDDLLEDFDRGRTKISYEFLSDPLRVEESSESIATFSLRMKLWLRKLEESHTVDVSVVLLVGGGAIEMLMATLVGLPIESLNYRLFDLKPFHAHVWFGERIQGDRFAWCLKAANAPLSALPDDKHPARHLSLVSSSSDEER